MKVYLYILRSSPNPNRVERSVPYAVDDEEIFFGPCKKRLRRKLRVEFLNSASDSAEPVEDIYLAGFNGSDGTETRRIVWAGRIKKVMTFARADAELRGERYRRMREHRSTPLHLRPRLEDGQLVGYDKVGLLHRKEWVSDIVEHPRNLPPASFDGTRIVVHKGSSAWEMFTRDACLLLENVFYATKAGIDIDDEILGVLKAAQGDDTSVDSYAVFGRTKNHAADGRCGCWLLLEGSDAATFVAAVRKRARALTQDPLSETDEEHRCTCDPNDPTETEPDC